MAKTFRCKLVTPSSALFDGAATYASIPAWDGLLGILPGRAPILARLGLGELRVDTDAGSQSFLVEDGFVKMANDELTVLAERATPAAALTAADADAELRSADAITDRDKRKRAHDRATLKRKLAKA